MSFRDTQQEEENLGYGENLGTRDDPSTARRNLRSTGESLQQSALGGTGREKDLRRGENVDPEFQDQPGLGMSAGSARGERENLGDTIRQRGGVTGSGRGDNFGDDDDGFGGGRDTFGSENLGSSGLGAGGVRQQKGGLRRGEDDEFTGSGRGDEFGQENLQQRSGAAGLGGGQSEGFGRSGGMQTEGGGLGAGGDTFTTGGDQYSSNTSRREQMGRQNLGEGVVGGDTYGEQQGGDYTTSSSTRADTGDPILRDTMRDTNTGRETRSSAQQRERAGLGATGNSGAGLGAIGSEGAYQEEQSGKQGKKKDSTAGKMMEKLGGMLGSQKMEESGREKREDTARKNY